MDWVCFFRRRRVHSFYRPISLSLYTKWSELRTVDKALSSIHQKDIRIVLYIVDDRSILQEGDNCVYHDDVRTEVNLFIVLSLEFYSSYYIGL